MAGVTVAQQRDQAARKATSNVNAETNTDQLRSLIQERLRTVEALHDFAGRQAELVQNREMTSLLSLLANKQRLLEQLQRIERALDPFRQQDPDSRAWPTPRDRLDCQRMAERCEDLLREVIQLEQRSEQELETRRAAGARQLEQVQSAGRATRAYQAVQDRAASRLNLLSED